MPNEFVSILSAFECIPKRLFGVVCGYLFCLTLQMKKHTFRSAAKVSQLDESRFSAFLNSPEARKMTGLVLNRASRRRLAKVKKIDGRLTFIIDSTIVGRRGKQVENAQRYHSGASFVNGHKFVNFVVLTPSGVIPIASIPVYTQDYCKAEGINYRSEIDIVFCWLDELKNSELFSSSKIQGALFLMDSGFDVKVLQNKILELGADFLQALKCSRSVNGKQVREYFWTQRRWLPWTSIRLNIGTGKKTKRRKYSIRTATGANLKGVGPVTVVYSKAKSRSKESTKYLATSALSLTGRQIVQWYARRWAIETWHREMKQNYGFIDCRCARFSAIEAHVNLCLAAFLIAKEKSTEQRTLDDFVLLRELKRMAKELTRFGGAKRGKRLVDAAIQDIAA